MQGKGIEKNMMHYKMWCDRTGHNPKETHNLEDFMRARLYVSPDETEIFFDHEVSDDDILNYKVIPLLYQGRP